MAGVVREEKRRHMQENSSVSQWQLLSCEDEGWKMTWDFPTRVILRMMIAVVLIRLDMFILDN
jgi:hypothetical protein